MAFTGQPGPGRPKGSKNKATKEREARAAALMAPGVVAPKNSGGKTGSARKTGPAPSKAPDGISPKDLLLTSMRAAWDTAHAIMAVVAEHEADLALLGQARAGQPLTNYRRLGELMGMKPGEVVPDDAIAKAADKLRAEITRLKIDAGAAATRAQALAKDVAPYEHAKLQNVDGKLVGDIFVEIKKF